MKHKMGEEERVKTAKGFMILATACVVLCFVSLHPHTGKAYDMTSGAFGIFFSGAFIFYIVGFLSLPVGPDATPIDPVKPIIPTIQANEKEGEVK